MKKLIILIIVLFGSITVFPQAEMKTYRLPNKTVAFSIPHGVGTEIFLMDSLKSYILNHSVTVAQTMNTVFTNSWYDLPSNSMSMDSSNINRLYFDSASGTMLTVTGTLAGATLNTGQGANELYDMDQNVLTTSTVTFIGTDGGTMTATTLNT